MCRYLIFPGQGAQDVAMGVNLAENLPICREIFDRASDLLGFNLLKLCKEGPIEELTRSSNAQPAIFVVSLASRLALTHYWNGKFPAMGTAGLSSGEWAALYEAGVLSFEDTVLALRARGEFMQQCCEETEGGMLTIIGLPIEKVCEVAAASGLEVANLNSPEQTVLSGVADRLADGEAAAKAAGAKRALKLTVAGAFHSSLMKPAAEKLADFLENIDFLPPRMPVWSNVTGKPHTTPDEIRQRMVEQVYSSVKWVDCIKDMVSSGMNAAWECGPGKVLAGLMRRIDSNVAVQNIFDLATAQEAAKLSLNM